MNGLKIFLAWGLTVVIGSLLPAIFSGLTGTIGFGLFISLITLIISAICSTPTLIVLVIVCAVNQPKGDKICRKRVIIAHIIMFLLTLGIGRFFENSSEIFSPFTMVTCYFAVIGTVVWLFVFLIKWKKDQHIEEWSALQLRPDEDSDAILRMD